MAKKKEITTEDIGKEFNTHTKNYECKRKKYIPKKSVVKINNDSINTERLVYEAKYPEAKYEGIKWPYTKLLDNYSKAEVKKMFSTAKTVQLAKREEQYKKRMQCRFLLSCLLDAQARGEQGIDLPYTNRELMIAALVHKAQTGDVQAIKLATELLGEYNQHVTIDTNVDVHFDFSGEVPKPIEDADYIDLSKNKDEEEDK